MGIYQEVEKRVLKKNSLAFLYIKNNKVFSLSYYKLADLVKKFSCKLISLGLKKGNAVGIFLHNSIEWVIADLAALRAGLITVPINPKMPAEKVEFILKDAKIKAVVSSKELVNGIRLKKIRFIDVNNFKKYLDSASDSEEAPEVSDEDIATICYTSGSTGMPKGVILTHKNITSNVHNQPVLIGEDDRFISYLPLSHMFERTCGYYAPLFNGANIVLCENPEDMGKYAERFRPSILIAIPRVIEKVDLKLRENKKAMRFMKSMFTRWIVKNGLKKKLGGRLRFIISGGAPLDRKLLEKFWRLGIKIFEGYGLTECSPAVSTNHEFCYSLGSVGKPIKNAEVKIENNRVYVKGPGVMSSYTSKMLNKGKFVEGWLDTGDLGFLDSNGFLHIRGRVDDCIILSNGKKSFPEPIEEKLKRLVGVRNAFVYGDKRPHLIAVICSELEKTALMERLVKVNESLMPHERIIKFVIASEDFSIENGLLTHTLKLKRKDIYEKYRKEIEGLYKK